MKPGGSADRGNNGEADNFCDELNSVSAFEPAARADVYTSETVTDPKRAL